MTATLDTLLDEWAMWMRAAGMSPRTIESRRQLLLRLASVTDPATCGWQPLARFLGSPNFTRGTKQTYHNDLRQWFKWLMLMDYREDDPSAKLHKPRQPRRLPRPITTEELQRLLDGGCRFRTRAMILLGAYQGFRAHEIAKMRGDHIRDGVIRVVGKGEVDALLPLHPLVADVAQHLPEHGYWFPSPDDRSQPVTARNVSHVVSLAMRRAGIHGTCHQLRHWHGTYALQAAGGNLRVAQELLRHANIATTAAYTQVSDIERREALVALPAVDVPTWKDPRGPRRWKTGKPSPSTVGTILLEVAK